MKIEENISLLKLNTFAINAYAAKFAEFSTVEELRKLFSETTLNSDWIVLGGGSNMLFISNYKGLILHSTDKSINIIEKTDSYAIVRAGAGVVWDEFVEYCLNNNLYGSENLSLIPGTVGASPVQNIGAYGVEAKDIVESVEIFCPKSMSTRTLKNQECQFGYRDSIFKKELKGEAIVYAVTYRLSTNFTPNIQYSNLEEEVSQYGEVTAENVRRAVIDIRKAKLPDPSEYPNGGSFFKNPVINKEKYNALQLDYPELKGYNTDGGIKISAAWLIDKCGLKGYREGNVGVHLKQPLVLVNYGNATGKEVLEFSQKISNKVKDKFGIIINPEIVMI